ncbi:MAG: pentapeptide repeat-containing protein, partial [bacterium]
DANFTSADLRGASFKGALLWHARFDGADIRSLILPGGAKRDFSFTGAQFAPGCFRSCRR